MEKSLAVSYNIKHTLMTQIFIPRICPRKMKTYSQKNLYTNVRSSFIHKIRRTGKRRLNKSRYYTTEHYSTKRKKRRYNKTLRIASSILSFWYLLKCYQPKEAYPGYPNLMSYSPSLFNTSPSVTISKFNTTRIIFLVYVASPH